MEKFLIQKARNYDMVLIMKRKSLALITTTIFFFVTTACSLSPKKPSTPSPYEEISSQKEIARSINTSYEEDKWWKKEENQYFIMILIVLGVAVATSAAIFISYNARGLSISVHK